MTRSNAEEHTLPIFLIAKRNLSGDTVNVGGQENSLLVADVSIHEFGRWNAGMNHVMPGLFVEPLSRVECKISDRGDVVEIMMKEVVESRISMFYCKLYINYSRIGKKPFLLSVAKVNRRHCVPWGPYFDDVFW